MKLNQPSTRKAKIGQIVLDLPGPDRKRLPKEYRYRVVFQHEGEREPGCVMMWEVTGGREVYQIALERTDRGNTKWHCTCADATFRGEQSANYQCKHVHGLIQTMHSLREAM